jgi:hypothetical protein
MAEAKVTAPEAIVADPADTVAPLPPPATEESLPTLTVYPKGMDPVSVSIEVRKWFSTKQHRLLSLHCRSINPRLPPRVSFRAAVELYGLMEFARALTLVTQSGSDQDTNAAVEFGTTLVNQIVRAVVGVKPVIEIVTDTLPPGSSPGIFSANSIWFDLVHDLTGVSGFRPPTFSKGEDGKVTSTFQFGHVTESTMDLPAFDEAREALDPVLASHVRAYRAASHAYLGGTSAAPDSEDVYAEFIATQKRLYRYIGKKDVYLLAATG